MVGVDPLLFHIIPFRSHLALHRILCWMWIGVALSLQVSSLIWEALSRESGGKHRTGWGASKSVPLRGHGDEGASLAASLQRIAQVGKRTVWAFPSERVAYTENLRELQIHR